MNLSPALKQYAAQWLKQIPGFEERYLELSNAVIAIQNGELSWQALLSVTVHTWGAQKEAHHPLVEGEALSEYQPSESDASIARELVHLMVPSLEKLSHDIEEALEDGSYDEEMSRLLFHVRLATGSLYLAKGKLKPAVKLLSDATKTRYNIGLQRANFWGNIEKRVVSQREGISVPMTNDTALGKLIAGFVLNSWFLPAQNYERIMYMTSLATEATPSEGLFYYLRSITWIWPRFIIGLTREGNWENVKKGIELFGETEGVSDLNSVVPQKWDPLEQWGHLLHRLVNIVIYCVDEEDNEELPASPEESRLTSANYWAWELGQAVAALWQNEGRDFAFSLMETYDPGPSSDEWLDGLPVLSLIAECGDRRDWISARDYYLWGWRKTAKRHVHQLFQEGSDSGLYWAMRVGLADEFIKPREFSRPGDILSETPIDDKTLTGTTGENQAAREVLNPKVLAFIESAFDREEPKQSMGEMFAAYEKRLQSIEEKQETISSHLTYERTKEQLIERYGDWVNELANPGELYNAEFTFENLNQISWSTVVTACANSVEAEIRVRIIIPLKEWLVSEQGNDRLSIGTEPLRVTKDMEWSKVEKILRVAPQKQLLRDFFASLSSDPSFLFSELPTALEKLRSLRNPAAHGEQSPAAKAKEARRLVLGKPKNPGILKRLTEIGMAHHGHSLNLYALLRR